MGRGHQESWKPGAESPGGKAGAPLAAGEAVEETGRFARWPGGDFGGGDEPEA